MKIDEEDREWSMDDIKRLVTSATGVTNDSSWESIRLALRAMASRPSDDEIADWLEGRLSQVHDDIREDVVTEVRSGIGPASRRIR